MKAPKLPIFDSSTSIKSETDGVVRDRVIISWPEVTQLYSERSGGEDEGLKNAAILTDEQILRDTVDRPDGPLQLPSTDDNYIVVRKFIYNSLISPKWMISLHHPDAIRATVNNWHGTGWYLLFRFNINTLDSICPSWTVPYLVNGSQKVDPIPEHVQKRVGSCLIHEIGQRLGREPRIPPLEDALSIRSDVSNNHHSDQKRSPKATGAKRTRSLRRNIPQEWMHPASATRERLAGSTHATRLMQTVPSVKRNFSTGKYQTDIRSTSSTALSLSNTESSSAKRIRFHRTSVDRLQSWNKSGSVRIKSISFEHTSEGKLPVIDRRPSSQPCQTLHEGIPPALSVPSILVHDNNDRPASTSRDSSAHWTKISPESAQFSTKHHDKNAERKTVNHPLQRTKSGNLQVNKLHPSPATSNDELPLARQPPTPPRNPMTASSVNPNSLRQPHERFSNKPLASRSQIPVRRSILLKSIEEALEVATPAENKSCPSIPLMSPRRSLAQRHSATRPLIPPAPLQDRPFYVAPNGSSAITTRRTDLAARFPHNTPNHQSLAPSMLLPAQPAPHSPVSPPLHTTPTRPSTWSRAQDPPATPSTSRFATIGSKIPVPVYKTSMATPPTLPGSHAPSAQSKGVKTIRKRMGEVVSSKFRRGNN